MRWWQLAPVLMLLAACAAPPPAPVKDYSILPATPATEEPPDGYTVRRGDTLYSVAFRFGIDVNDLAAWNGIGAPYTIYPGQELKFEPTGSARTAGAAPSAAGSSRVQTEPLPEQKSPAGEKPAAAPRTSHREEGAEQGRTAGAAQAARASGPEKKPPAGSQSAHEGPLNWRWPADGPVLSSFDAADASRKGIDIGGKPGDPVYAAASGTVVYSGSGLIGYGELIIVKHDDKLLSAYGHNRKRLVQEGEQVRAGQRIAEMGSTGAPRPMLHFEIRVEGKPVNPAKYLPSR